MNNLYVKTYNYYLLKIDALNLTAEWLKRHVDFEKTTEPYHDIIVRAYLEIFNWDENVIFPEVIIYYVKSCIRVILFTNGFIIIIFRLCL